MMSEGKTIGQLMEEMRAKAGAQNYHGHAKAYLLAALFNSVSTIDHYYTMQYNHDYRSP